MSNGKSIHATETTHCDELNCNLGGTDGPLLDFLKYFQRLLTKTLTKSTSLYQKIYFKDRVIKACKYKNKLFWYLAMLISYS